MKRWWLSFCDPDRPEGNQFLGIAIVLADDFLSACFLARLTGCNPGGEVMGAPLPDSLELDRTNMHRLLSRAEAEEIDRGWGLSRKLGSGASSTEVS